MKKIIWFLSAFILFITGCGTSRITSSWKAEDSTTHFYKKILVLGLIRESDRAIQENMENHLAGDLNVLGFNAVTSMGEYGPKAFENMNEEDALSKLKNSGIDAVVTIVLLNKEKERRYVAGQLYYSPYGYYYSRFWGYRGILYHRIYEPGYYATDTKYFWETNLYEMNTQKLLYSVQTQSFDPVNTQSLAHEYGQLIVKDMTRKKVLTHAEPQKPDAQKAF